MFMASECVSEAFFLALDDERPSALSRPNAFIPWTDCGAVHTSQV